MVPLKWAYFIMQQDFPIVVISVLKEPNTLRQPVATQTFTFGNIQDSREMNRDRQQESVCLELHE